MPPAGGEARGELRATVGRLAHERFTDERVGELLEAAEPRDELEADVVRVARRDFDKARRVPGELVAEMARAGVAARGAWLQAREDGDFALLRALPGAQHRAAPALQRVLPRGRAPLRPAARRLRARACARPRCARRSSACATGSSRSSPRPREIDDTLLRVGPFPEAGQRALLEHRPARDRRRRRSNGASTRPRTRSRRRSPTTDVRLTTRYDEADLDSLYSRPARVRPRALRAPGRPRARPHAARRTGASSAWHESQSRLWENMVGRSPRLLALVPARTRRRRCPSASPASTLAGGPAGGQRRAPEPHPRERRRGHLRAAHRPALRARARAASRATWPSPTCPAAWNERMRAYLGLDVPDDVHGVLQDIHWAEGAVRLLPDLRAGQRHRRPAVGARDAPSCPTSTSASRPATSRRCASGWPSTSTASAAAT